ncbi:MAG: flavin reductase family protein [Desulfovibrionaceae bacterium]
MFQSLGACAFAVPTPVFLVGSYDSAGKANIMTAAWGGICASQPPCLSVSIAKARWTHAAIQSRNAFTVSIPSRDQVAQADFAGMYSGRSEDKFATLGFTPTAAEHVDAPYVAECPVVIELRLTHSLELGSHTQFIGEIMDVKVHAHCLDAKGTPLLNRIDPLLFIPQARQYWSVGNLVARALSVGRSVDKKALIGDSPHR